ncbi:hypothetical protein I7I48_06975 [Histoplasma ohiense]|nr:hypothetical protein I7I48_06975 [Histoplasma ohiense (nom. inval.)]
MACPVSAASTRSCICEYARQRQDGSTPRILSWSHQLRQTISSLAFPLCLEHRMKLSPRTTFRDHFENTTKYPQFTLLDYLTELRFIFGDRS